MDIQFLKEEFLENSKKLNSVDEKSLDKKHLEIISKSHENLNKLDLKNFRNWEGQTDQGLKYPMSFISLFFLNIKKFFLLNRLFSLSRKRLNHIFQYSSMCDDIEIIKLAGGYNLLKENPQYLTPGSDNYRLINGFSVTSRWLRYIYILNQIQKNDLLKNKKSIWLDVGSYYGGLQGLVKKYNPSVTMILVDFSHQLLRSYVYLKTLYPESNHVFPDHIYDHNDILSLNPGSIVYLDVTQFNSIENLKVDLATNFFSFGEMKVTTFEEYLNSGIFKNANYIYSANRFVSAPFFEKTYDSNLNIFNYNFPHKLIYFDIFPMGNFHCINRKLFGREFLRNISSQYFEGIWAK